MRNMHEKLINAFNQLVVMRAGQQEDVRLFFQPISLPKNVFLLEKGEICHALYFLGEGATRHFYCQDDKEITSCLNFEGDFVTSMYSFVSRKPSVESIITISDCQLLSISHKNLQHLYNKDLVWNKIGRLLVEQSLIKLKEHLFSLQSKTASERYDDLVSQHPEMLDRIKLGYLASFLGITQETLSRIRAKHRNRQRIKASQQN